MKYKLITSEDSKITIDANLSVEEIKMLYNATVDIVKIYPSMTGYKNLRDKLSVLIEHYELTK